MVFEQRSSKSAALRLSHRSNRVSGDNFRFRRAARAFPGAPAQPMRAGRGAPSRAGRLDTWTFRQFALRKAGSEKKFSTDVLTVVACGARQCAAIGHIGAAGRLAGGGENDGGRVRRERAPRLRRRFALLRSVVRSIRRPGSSQTIQAR